MKTRHGCEDVGKCECGYIEDEEFELQDNIAKRLWARAELKTIWHCHSRLKRLGGEAHFSTIF